MSLYSRLDRIAADVARLDRQLTSVSNHPQSQRTSVEGGSIDFNDDDGNLMAIVGSQDDGGNTINVISGPTPPTPVGFTVDVDHGKFIVHWSGDFEGDALAPSDWSRAEVHASQDPFFVPSRATARGSIVSAAGGEVTIGVLKGPWTIKMLAWSQAGKMSAPSAPVDVEVPGYGEIVLEEIDAAETEIVNGGGILLDAQGTLGEKLDSAFSSIDSINDDLSDLGDAVSGAVESANGKNTVHYDTVPPTTADEGVEGDTWFVGQVGRPNDVVQATNLAPNPSFELGTDQPGWGSRADLAADIETSTEWSESGSKSLKVTGNGGNTASSAYYLIDRTASVLSPGKTYTISATARLSGPLAGTLSNDSRRIVFGTRNASTGGYAYSVSKSTPAPNKAGTTRLSHTFTVPAGFYGFIRLMNGSSSSSMWWDDIDLAEVSEPRPYFDGDTEDGTTDNDPHYRWTGEPHASTSEKYLPALDIGDDGTWNVTEQYRFQNGGWVQVELSHTVLSSLDLGKLVAGSAAIKEAVVEKLFAEVVVSRMSVADEFIGENAILTGAVTAPKITASEELWAKLAQFVRVNAEMVDSDVFRGRVFEGNTYLQDDGSEWSGRGLFIVAPDGETLLNVPTNGEPVTINADNTAIRSASIDNLDAGDTSLTTGSTLTLEAGQQAYPRAPEIWADWYPSATFDRPDPGHSYDWTGLAAWGDKWVRGVNVLGAAGDALDSLEIYDEDGTLERNIPIDNNPRHGVTVIGDIAYVLGPDHLPTNTKDWVHGFNLNTGARVSRWELTTSAANRVAVGATGASLVTAVVTAAGNLSVNKWNPTTGARVGDNASTPWDVRYTNDLVGVHITGSTVYICHRQNVRTYTLSGSTLTQSFGLGWENPNKNATGMDMTRGWPFVITEGGNLYEGSVFVGGDNMIEAAVTFRDSQGHETDSSPTAAVGLAARQSAVIGIPHRPNLTTRVYYRLGAGEWQWYDLDEATKRFWVDFIPETREANPPTVNTFPNDEPSTIQAAAGPFEVHGDGTGYWGPLKVGANGVMSGLIVSGQTVCSVDTANTPKKFTISLPAGRFSKPPIVWVAPSTTVPQKVSTGVLWEDIRATSFDLYFSRDTTTPTGVAWFAMDSE